MQLDHIIDRLELRACQVMAAERSSAWRRSLLEVRDALLEVRAKLAARMEVVCDPSHAMAVRGVLERLVRIDGILEVMLAAYTDEVGEEGAGWAVAT